MLHPQKGRAAVAPAATSTVQVLRKHHTKIAQGGRFFRALPNGTRVTHDGVKPPTAAFKLKKPPTLASSPAPSARIDDEAGEAPVDTEIVFQVVALYDGTEEDDGSEIPWVVESASQEDADRTTKEIERQLDLAKSATHVGWLTVPRSLSEYHHRMLSEREY